MSGFRWRIIRRVKGTVYIFCERKIYTVLLSLVPSAAFQICISAGEIESAFLIASDKTPTHALRYFHGVLHLQAHRANEWRYGYCRD